MNLNFKKWVEDVSAKEAGDKDTILNFLKDELGITDDETILAMKIGSIDKGIINNLLKHGIIASANNDLLDDIKNGSITVEELIQRLSSGGAAPSQLNLNIASTKNNQFTN